MYILIYLYTHVTFTFNCTFNSFLSELEARANTVQHCVFHRFPPPLNPPHLGVASDSNARHHPLTTLNLHQVRAWPDIQATASDAHEILQEQMRHALCERF